MNAFIYQWEDDAHLDSTNRKENFPNWHSFNILHMEGIADELKRAGGIAENEIKSGEGYNKWKEVFHE